MGEIVLSEDWQSDIAPELSEREKMLRDKFITEYMYDMSPTSAAMRCGFAEAFAREYAKKFMSEPYVIDAIKMRQHKPEDDGAAERDKAKVFASLRREIDYGTPASRVSAAVALAKYRGMDPAIKTVTDINLNNPVQFYIPYNGRDPIPEGATVVNENDRVEDGSHI